MKLQREEKLTKLAKKTSPKNCKQVHFRPFLLL